MTLTEITSEMKYTEEQVLKIVDSCFHMYASHYRTDARDCAKEIMKGMINKELQQVKSENEKALPICGVSQLSELLIPYTKWLRQRSLYEGNFTEQQLADAYNNEINCG